jgi:hypothetical protein
VAPFAPGGTLRRRCSPQHPRDAGACTARDVREPRSWALTAHPSPDNSPPPANLDAQGGLDFLSFLSFSGPTLSDTPPSIGLLWVQRFGPDLRAFVSGSYSDANKWRGPARSDRGGTRPRVSAQQPLSRRLHRATLIS